jgi:hypothetical protein
MEMQYEDRRGGKPDTGRESSSPPLEEPEALDLADQEKRSGDDDRDQAELTGLGTRTFGTCPRSFRTRPLPADRQGQLDGLAGVGLEQDRAFERRGGGQGLPGIGRALIGDAGQDDSQGDGKEDPGLAPLGVSLRLVNG